MRVRWKRPEKRAEKTNECTRPRWRRARARRLYYDRPGYAGEHDGDDDDDERAAGMEAAKQEDGDNCARQCTRLLPLFKPKACNCKCQATHFAVRTHDTFGRSRRASRTADAMRSAFALPHCASVRAFIACMNACICTHMCVCVCGGWVGGCVCASERLHVCICTQQ